ncbi:MAG: Cyclic di-GMP phosphodiesterase response regulator RpfG [Syntrophorhabdus sp. PtaU1.Bin058]|nr:MAG: Cyclic di-GMP phosphodiesterase response regulator RpfG [Syntrophorhabdus sp. PtaU1.Bin058]
MENESSQTTIMVVDDTPANLKLLDDILRRCGYRVLTFPRGNLALKAAAKNPPDLILLDINMPEMNGFEVCERLKADAVLKAVPVLFISALTETADKVRAFNAGGVDYISKPFQFEEVQARVETHLRIRRLRIELERHNRHLEDLVKEKIGEISDSQMATILALSKLAESRDDETGHHIERTRTFCRVLAEELRGNFRYAGSIDDAFVENIYHASPLHDIGKVGIPDSILLKPDKLTPAEFEIMKTHTTIAADTLRLAHEKYHRNAFLNMGIAIARSHHERWDGTGYPDGLEKEDIPLSGRIMALADVYDALRSKRPYKDAFSHNKSCAIITEGSGSHFDPAVIEAFRAIEPEFAGIRERMDDDIS